MPPNRPVACAAAYLLAGLALAALAVRRWGVRPGDPLAINPRGPAAAGNVLAAVLFGPPLAVLGLATLLVAWPLMRLMQLAARRPAPRRGARDARVGDAP